MEPLPTQGQALRHYTASRPRPRRTHTEPPSSRPQEPESKVDNEADDAMGRVDEGVEEFFTKKILPDHTQKARWEESNPAQTTPSDSSSTPSASVPFSSSENVPSSITISITSSSAPPSNAPLTSTDATPMSTSPLPPTTSDTTSSSSSSSTLPTKNIKKKFGDFFAFKRARAGRAAKAGGGEGGGEGVRVKRTSIADLIRPLREARERERDKERGTRSGEDANVSNDAAMTEGTAAVGRRLAGEESMAPGKTVTTATPPIETTPSCPITATTTTPDLTKVTLSNLEEEAVTTPPAVTTMATPEVKMEAVPFGDQRLKATKRSLREGKSQSLILLTGLEPEDKDNAHSKTHASESTSSFEQRLQVMLHRMGVAKTPPTDVKTSQNKDEELRKANSEGTILDKPRPPPTYMKPRTMSTSSADSRHPARVLDSVRPEPPLHPKPVLPERPAGRLPPKPPIAAKPTLPAPAAPAGDSPLSSAPPSSSSADKNQVGPRTLDSKTAQPEVQEGLQGAASAPSPRKELPPPVPSPWRCPSAQGRSEKAQSVTDESLPNPRIHLKPLPQRRAVSVHEDTLSMTQELKAVLQRSPVRFRGNRSDLPTCSEDPSSVEEAPPAAGGRGEPEVQDQENVVQKDEVKTDRDGTGVEIKPSPPGEEDVWVSSSSESSRVHGDRTPSTSDRPPTPTQTPPLPPTSHEKSPVLGLDKLPVSSPSQEKILSTTENLEKSRASPGTGSGKLGSSTEERGAVSSKPNQQAADQRTKE